MIPYNKKLVNNARMLRKRMTKEEKRIWYDFLKKLPFTVKRQHNIENYIVDFYCFYRFVHIFTSFKCINKSGFFRNYSRTAYVSTNSTAVKCLVAPAFSSYYKITPSICAISQLLIHRKRSPFSRKRRLIYAVLLAVGC